MAKITSSYMAGDWIQFQRNGGTYIDVVLFVRESPAYPYKTEFYTPHHGMIPRCNVISIRRDPRNEEA